MSSFQLQCRKNLRKTGNADLVGATMIDKIRYAVFPIAGAGSRLSPLTTTIPKAFLPLGNRTLLHWAMREAYLAGIREFIVILDSSSSRKRFFQLPGSRTKGKPSQPSDEIAEEWDFLVKRIVKMVPMRTDMPLGFASAIASAEGVIKKEQFAVMMADTVLLDARQGLPAIARTVEANDQCAIGLTRISRRQYKEFGVVTSRKGMGDSLRILSAREKPGMRFKKQGLGIAGRYIFSGDMFDVIEGLRRWAESQVTKTGFHMTKAIDCKARQRKVSGIVMKSPFFHVGTFKGYFDAWHHYLDSLSVHPEWYSCVTSSEVACRDDKVRLL
jgi:UTP--glucose-1-phosphate uridylyltransferase